jgi:hypothetical protein
MYYIQPAQYSIDAAYAYSFPSHPQESALQFGAVSGGLEEVSLVPKPVCSLSATVVRVTIHPSTYRMVVLNHSRINPLIKTYTV